MKPLAERMRPRSFGDMIGQSHLVAENAVLFQLAKSGQLPSMILWGPPGSGKTSLSQILAAELKRSIFTLSAINSGVKDVRDIFEKISKGNLFSEKTPVLFIDEIHRFSKSQQDSLLHEVEKGAVILVGATTENPSFEVISPLLSRCQIYLLKPISAADLEQLLFRAIQQDTLLKQKNIEIAETKALVEFADGDARKLLNNLEIVIGYLESSAAKLKDGKNDMQGATAKLQITNEVVEAGLQQKFIRYDKNGEEHYNVISAFIKSMRGSDPNAAVYWLARLIEAGEKPEFIARRMTILASEDIGLANPNALLIAMACFDAIHKIGWPESRIILSQTAVYLAVSPKSNSTYMAINEAQETVRNTGNLQVPVSLRNPVTKLMKNLDYGKNYKYAHDFEDNFTAQDFLPEEIKSTVFYKPGKNPRETEIKNRLQLLWKKIYRYD
ncbi:MAG: replication-associated recombination protein A [Spirochaetia bacterium]|nr:replication-associated recombination protein A [Spirochaetia bacterium]